MNQSAKTYRLQISIPPELQSMLFQESKDSGLSYAEIVRGALWDKYKSMAKNEMERKMLEDLENG